MENHGLICPEEMWHFKFLRDETKKKKIESKTRLLFLNTLKSMLSGINFVHLLFFSSSEEILHGLKYSA